MHVWLSLGLRRTFWALQSEKLAPGQEKCSLPRAVSIPECCLLMGGLGVRSEGCLLGNSTFFENLPMPTYARCQLQWWAHILHPGGPESGHSGRSDLKLILKRALQNRCWGAGKLWLRWAKNMYPHAAWGIGKAARRKGGLN